jgi:subtilase family serine protease
VFTWTPASGQTGAFSFNVIVTDDGTPSANDGETITVTVSAPAAPNLLLTALTTTASAVRPGTSFNVSTTANNNGNATAGTSTIAFHLSADAVYGGPDDVVLTGTRSVTSLAPGATSTASTSVSVPTQVTTGMYYVCATADASGVVAESNEADNGRCSTATVQIEWSDLTTTLARPEAASATLNGRLDFTDTVANIGPVASTSFTMAYRLSSNAVAGDADDVLLSTRRNVSALAAGASSTATTRLQIPKTMPLGTYYVCAVADGGAVVPERDETNNARCSTTTVQIVR